MTKPSLTNPIPMRATRRPLALGALVLAGAALAAGCIPANLAAAGSGAGAGSGGSAGTLAGAGTAALSCEIRQSRARGQLMLEPMVSAASGASGSYSLTLAGGGSGNSSTISQGGGFTAPPGRATSLGQVSLDGGGVYRARLEVSAGGGKAVCAGKVGGAL
ncbi:curli-like amyloid fiber formation chaperone CsgH [Kaistia geumhonensis]|uniref:CsgH-like domain-containing protein n=1 Tax=Kaistia geumhonensis TaxID=410839 RepID=A0ABU0M3Q9_9HYPH|nr:curli-like amyloid fiber formation chaperone CsgH [Kaistia geumhonensis]MCX5479210.1 curli-like amyloid fiber formation chaperone CsgH [Kaistia geumhonensis]MDQ0515570.1 hypothetical protein [Kaistia geumhonensis]